MKFISDESRTKVRKVKRTDKIPPFLEPPPNPASQPFRPSKCNYTSLETIQMRPLFASFACSPVKLFSGLG